MLGSLNPGKLEAVERAMRECATRGGDPANETLSPSACQLEEGACQWRVQGVTASSGVREQPWGLMETMKGAKARAIYARASYLKNRERRETVHAGGEGVGREKSEEEGKEGGPSFPPSPPQQLRLVLGVGLESGVVRVDDDALMDFCACALYDGRTHAVGLSSMWQLPPFVASRLLAEEAEAAAEAMESESRKNGQDTKHLNSQNQNHHQERRGYNAAFESLGLSPDPTGAGVLSVLTDGRLSRPLQMREAVKAAWLQLSAPPGMYTFESLPTTH